VGFLQPIELLPRATSVRFVVLGTHLRQRQRKIAIDNNQHRWRPEELAVSGLHRLQARGIVREIILALHVEARSKKKATRRREETSAVQPSDVPSRGILGNVRYYGEINRKKRRKKVIPLLVHAGERKSYYARNSSLVIFHWLLPRQRDQRRSRAKR